MGVIGLEVCVVDIIKLYIAKKLLTLQLYFASLDPTTLEPGYEASLRLCAKVFL